MTYAPPRMLELARLYVANGGTNLGIVGDAAHAARPTYHNGWDRAVARYGTTDMAVVASKDYSFRPARDRVKSDAAMGFDFGKIDGSLAELRRFSVWLSAQLKAGAPGSADVREFIYSPDGQRVVRWDNIDKVLRSGYPTATGQGDSSHLWHSHISFYRDSRERDKTALIAPYFGETMKAFRVPERRLVVAVPDKTWLYTYSDKRSDPGNIQVSPGRDLAYVGRVDSKIVIVAYEPAAADDNASSLAMYMEDNGNLVTKTAPGTMIEKIVEVPVPTGITQEQVDAAKREAAKMVADAAAAKAAEL